MNPTIVIRTSFWRVILCSDQTPLAEFFGKLPLRLLLMLCMSTTLWQCEKHQAPNDWLAQVGGRYITANEFVSRAELSPPPRFRSVNGLSDKRGLLELLIGEKLLANEAEVLGLHRAAAFRQWKHYTEGVAVVKELYREEVQSKVEVRESEIDTAAALAQKSLLIKFFKSDRQEEAERFLTIAGKKGSFDLAIQDYFGIAIPAENYASRFTFGNGDEHLENAVFALQPGQMSRVINTSKGFFVVHVVEAQTNRTLTQGEHLQQRAAIKKILRVRKADKLSAQFVQRFMSDKGVVLKGKAFSIVTKYIAQHLDFGLPPSAPKLQPLAEIDYRRAENDLSDYLNEALIVFAGGQWTIHQTLEKLRLRNLPFNSESPLAMRRTLEGDLQAMVRDEFLAQEGYRRNLHKRAAVQEEVQMWVDHHLYTLMMNRLNLQPQTPTSLRPSLNGKSGQAHDEIEFPPHVSRLKNKYRVVVADDKLSKIELTGINMIAVHPGRPHQLAVPLWPLF